MKEIIMSAGKVPLRPVSPIDAELAKPHPKDLTEIEKEKEQTEEDAHDEKAQDQRDREHVETERERSDRRPI
jgi:hypothetical protein